MITGKLKKSQSEVSIRQGDERLIRLTEQAGNKVSSLLSTGKAAWDFASRRGRWWLLGASV